MSTRAACETRRSFPRMRRGWVRLLVVCVFLGAFAAARAEEPARAPAIAAEAKIDPWLVRHLRRGGTDSFLVRFEAPESLRAGLEAAARSASGAGPGVYERLRRRAAASQRATRAWLDARGIRYRSLYIVNALRVEGDLALATALAARPEVARIVGDPAVRGIEAERGLSAPAPEAVEWGVSAIRAPLVWSLDAARGQGITVATADTGVEWNHPALLLSYRGWNGLGASHDYHWHDAIRDLPVPLDDHNHGTHVTGTMVGDDGAGNQIGVAPAARWIGCRNMDFGVGRPSTYLECIQYFLAPWPNGGDAETDGDPNRAPDIVNNSWACPPSEGCDPLTLRDGFAALEAAGILAVASAGNAGPACSTVANPPGIYAEVVSVGATNATNTLRSFSSRGPVTIDGSGRLRPDLAAPGSGVRSSVRNGGYALFSGTSMAAPHVAGQAALLWSAKPGLRDNIGLTRCVITRSAAGGIQLATPQTCGGTGISDRPNHLFGWGLADAYAAIHPATDVDADGIEDACDCDASDPGAYDRPEGVRGLSIGPEAIEWRSQAGRAGAGTVYDLIRGDLADLLERGTIEAGDCLASGMAVPGWLDPEAPASGDAFFYVVRARNGCGDGGFGADSSGTPRAHLFCPLALAGSEARPPRAR